MIVDLMRNDLGRVCTYGSVIAPPEPTAEPHPGLWHLVSRVHGELRPEVGNGDLLRATFPPGSVTGAPKVQALKVIAALEPAGREVYTGAIGFASPVAGLELNVAIRTLECGDGRLWLGAGGGIVADSDPRSRARGGAREGAPDRGRDRKLGDRRAAIGCSPSGLTRRWAYSRRCSCSTGACRRPRLTSIGSGARSRSCTSSSCPPICSAPRCSAPVS